MSELKVKFKDFKEDEIRTMWTYIENTKLRPKYKRQKSEKQK